MFEVRAGGYSFPDLSASEAARKARSLRESGMNDVEVFRSAGERISQYALEEIVRSEAENH